MKTPDTTIILPTLWRHDRLRWVHDNILDNSPEDVYVWYLVEQHDKDTISTTLSLPQSMTLVGNYGTANKAINYGASMVKTPYFYIACDDLEFTPNWLENALAAMHNPPSHGPLPRVAATWNGIHEKGISGFLINTEYAKNPGGCDEPGKVFHEGYYHYYADSEFVAWAEKRGVYVFAHNSKVIHHNVSSGKYEPDRTTSKIHDSGQHDDYGLFKRRCEEFSLSEEWES